MRKWAVMVLVGAMMAGCASSDSSDEGSEEALTFPYYDPVDGLYHYRVWDDAGNFLAIDWAPGALSTASATGGDFLIELPSHSLVIEGASITEGFGMMPVEPGTNVTFILSPAARTVQGEYRTEDDYVFVFVGDPARDGIATEPWNQVISGENMWDLEAYQEENFPDRTPGEPNYALSVDYFAQYFRDLGMEVEVDPFGTRGLTDTTGCSPVGLNSLCPESLANIVATKPGTDPTKVIFVAGGHFDMVPGTTHAAFDDTSGVVGTMELARALAPYEFEHTLMFGLWGGEENGILGSQFWVQSHPEMRARIVSYWNLDVIGMSWPAPLPEPEPVVISAGPDAPSGNGGETQDPVSGDLLDWARTLQTEWLGFPDEVNGTRMFHYEGHAAGQAGGYAQVNAQSDHTPFAAAGIPSYFIFNGDTLNGNPIGIHNEKDTLVNMTLYSWYGDLASFDDPWPDPTTYEPAKQMLARSWETTIWFPFYHTVLTDLGVYTPPAVAARVPST